MMAAKINMCSCVIIIKPPKFGTAGNKKLKIKAVHVYHE